MTPRTYLCSAFIIVAACEPMSPSRSQVDQTAPRETTVLKTDEQDYSLCGATTTKRRIDEYFEQIASFLEAPSDKSALRNLVAENVVMVRGGQSQTVSASAIVEARPYLIPVEDWAEMSRRGESRLASGGWRGCFFSNGKATFNVDESGHLRLSAFNVDMAWVGGARPQ